jgi:cytidylate kinase
MKAVRLILLDFQRKFAKSRPNGKSGTILDGRDIATVVCPDADFKFFVTANIEIRAKRRCKQLIESDEPAIYARVLEDLSERDTRDSSRHNAPLLKDSDAISIDTSYLNAEQTFETARNYIASRDFNRQRI